MEVVQQVNNKSCSAIMEYAKPFEKVTQYARNAFETKVYNRVDASKAELKLWIDNKCNLGLDILEYALEIIEQYDAEFHKRIEKKEDKELVEKKMKTSERFDEVKSSYKQLILLQRERALEFVMTSFAYKLANEHLHIPERFEKSYEYTCQLYNCLNTKVVVPIQDKVVLIYDTSLKKASLVLETIQSNDLAKRVGEKYSNAKVTIARNWMRLDLNNDGKVTFSDIIEAVRSLQSIVRESQLATKALEYKNTLYRRAIGYIEREKQAKKVSEEEQPLLERISEEENSSDSVEMKNMGEKDN